MIECRIGDCRQLIHGLDNESIDCVMTLPPYWGLRDYKTEPIIFDGLPDCEHEFTIKIRRNNDKSGGHGNVQEGLAAKTCDAQDSARFGEPTQLCSKCGAWRGQLGLEPTPELYLKHLLDFFDDVKLKLKDTGNCFVNLGDSYAGSGVNDGTKNAGMSNAANRNDVKGTSRPNTKVQGLKPKCLCMIPQRFAWGMIERGWILRNEIIWAKPNHMPESVTDRLTKAHEVIYHFVKQGKYYYDLDAIREPNLSSTTERNKYDRNGNKGGADRKLIGYPITKGTAKGTEYNGKWVGNESYMNEVQRRINDARANGIPHDEALNNPKGKNPGDVWTITTQPYPESHFAVFPLELVRRPILAGCPKGGTVLDPFGGSGTVGDFCRHNERNAILFELNPDYKKFIDDRAMINMPELSSWCSSQEDAYERVSESRTPP